MNPVSMDIRERMDREGYLVNHEILGVSPVSQRDTYIVTLRALTDNSVHLVIVREEDVRRDSKPSDSKS